MRRLAVQYLEDGPEVACIEPGSVRARLREAFQRLPISDVLVGWNLRDAQVSACAEEVSRAHAQLYRWHPLLSGDGTLVPRIEWQSIGLDGSPVPGFRGLPEFTFVCPNRPAVREAVLGRLSSVCGSGHYQGIFLDRIRYPSPSWNPARFLACFCDDCCRAARQSGLDLISVQHHVGRLFSDPERARAAIQVLLDSGMARSGDLGVAVMQEFLRFRAQSVTRLVCDAARVIRAAGLEVGLDCFAPALAHMVGQDLGGLDPCCDWIKIMSYGHTLGPAGMPFEILGLADWLVDQHAMDWPMALACLSRSLRLGLPVTRNALRDEGLSPGALASEVRRAREAGISKLLVGIELVELEEVSMLHPAQIAADLHAFCQAEPDGLVLSWDLWHIPVERLDVVREVWSYGGRSCA